MKRASLIVIIFLMIIKIYGQTGMPVLQLEELISEAIRNNPQILSAEYQADASRTKIDQVTSWDAPQVGVEFFQTPIKSFPNPFKDQMEMDYFVQQMIPFSGKLSAMGRMASSNSEMYRQNLESTKRKIIRDLKKSYYELYFVQRKIEINKENQELLQNFVEIASKQYEVGMGKQEDILRAQTELSTLVNEGINLLKEKKNVEAMINTILKRPPESTLGEILDIEIKAPEFTFDQLKTIVLETRPELKAMRSNIEMNQSEVKLSKLEYFPDFMVRVMYKDMLMTNNDFWSAMIGINIPLAFWSSDKYKYKVIESELNVKKAESDYESMKNMVLYEVQDALVKVRTNENLVSLYKTTVIPQAEQTLRSTISSYQTGKTEFLMLIDAYRMVLMAKLDYHMALMNYMSSQAELEQAVGIPIDEIFKRIK